MALFCVMRGFANGFSVSCFCFLCYGFVFGFGFVVVFYVHFAMWYMAVMYVCSNCHAYIIPTPFDAMD